MSDKEFPETPDLAGAIDLASPLQLVGRNFLASMAQKNGEAIVMIGLTSDGQVTVSSHTPAGGIMQAIALMELGKLAVYHGNQHAKEG